MRKPPKGKIPPGGSISEISDTPTSFPAPKRLGLSWEVQFIGIGTS